MEKEMQKGTAKFTLRISSELMEKFKFVAAYNGRSANKELETLMRSRVEQFEKRKGKIEL